MTQPPPLPVITATQTGTSPCNGDMKNSVTVSVANGTPGYMLVLGGTSYPLANSTQVQVFNNLAGGTQLTFTATDSLGCSAPSKRITPTDPSPLMVSLAVMTAPTCQSGYGNSTDGVITVTMSGGTGPYSINGGSPVSSPSTTAGSMGPNLVTVTDSNNCMVSKSITISNSQNDISFSSSHTDLTCNNDASGTISFTTTGSSPCGLKVTIGAAVMSTSRCSRTLTFSGYSAGAYSATVMNGPCTYNQPVTFTLLEPNPVSFTSTPQDAPCPLNAAGNFKGQVMVSNPTGGTPGYQMSVDSGPYGAIGTTSGLTVGMHSVVVKDSNGCLATAQPFTINAPSNFVLSVTWTDVTCAGAGDGTISIAAGGASGGTGALQYKINSGSFQALSLPFMLGSLVPGAYTFTLQDARSCTISTSHTVVDAPKLNYTVTARQDRCTAMPDGQIVITTATPGLVEVFSVSPSLPSGPVLPSTLNPTYTASGITGSPTVYTFTIDKTPSHTCAVFPTATVTKGPDPIITTVDITCPGQPPTLRVCASGGYPKYTITVTPPSMCSAANPSSFTIAASGGCASVQVMSGCTYTFSLSDLYNCPASTTGSASATNLPTRSNEVITGTSCSYTSDGAYSAQFSGGNTPWQAIGISPMVSGFTNGSLPMSPYTISLSNLAAGTYTIVITDANNCSNPFPFTIPSPTAISFTYSSTPPSCPTGSIGTLSDGTLTVTPAGGTGTLSVTINGSQSGTGVTTATGLMAGTAYSVAIRDANGCTGSGTATITGLTDITVSKSTRVNATCGDPADPLYATGSISVPVSGGTSPYSGILVVGSGGSTTPVLSAPPTATPIVFSMVAAGTYTQLSVIDNHGCMYNFSKSYLIGAPTPLGDTLADQSCFSIPYLSVSSTGGTPSVSATVTSSGYSVTQTLPSVFTSSGVNTLPFNTVISVLLTDANGCKHTDSITLASPAVVLSITPTVTNALCNGGKGSLSLSVQGGTSNYVVQWRVSGSGPWTNINGVTSMAPAVIPNLGAGSYDYRATDSHGCTTMIATATVTEPSPVTASITTSPPTCAGNTDGSVIVVPSGGTGTLTVTINGMSTSSLTMLGAGTYSIVVTDANMCPYSTSRTLTDPAKPSATLVTRARPTCVGFTNGQLNVGVSGGQGPPYTFTLSQGGMVVGMANQLYTGAFVSGIGAGSYTLVGYDSVGCPSVTAGPLMVTEVAATLTATAVPTAPLCFGGSGSVLVTPSGGLPSYTEYVSGIMGSTSIPASSSATINGIVAGSYNLSTVDANACVAYTGFVMTQPSLLSISLMYSQPVCVGQGVPVQVTISGGTGPFKTNMTGSAYSYMTGAATVVTFTNVLAGTYSFITTDANGCTATAGSITLAVASPLGGTLSDRTCFNDALGRFLVSPTGGTPYGSGMSAYYMVSVNGGAAVQVPAATGAVLSTTKPFPQTSTITITDSNACTITRTITPVKPVATISSLATVGASTCYFGEGTDNGVINATISGGTGPYTAMLSPDPDNIGLVSSTAGGFVSFTGVPGNSDNLTTTVMIFDAHQCPFNLSVVVTSPTPITVFLNLKKNVVCHNDKNAILESQLSGGNGRPYTSTCSPTKQRRAGDLAANSTSCIM